MLSWPHLISSRILFLIPGKFYSLESGDINLFPTVLKIQTIFSMLLAVPAREVPANEDVTHKRALHRRWDALIPSSDMPHQTASASTSRLSCFFTNPHQSNKSTRKKSWAVNICAVCACGGIRPLAASSLEKQWVGKWPSRADWLTNAIFSPISWSVRRRCLTYWRKLFSGCSLRPFCFWKNIELSNWNKKGRWVWAGQPTMEILFWFGAILQPSLNNCDIFWGYVSRSKLTRTTDSELIFLLEKC